MSCASCHVSVIETTHPFILLILDMVGGGGRILGSTGEWLRNASLPNCLSLDTKRYKHRQFHTFTDCKRIRTPALEV